MELINVYWIKCMSKLTTFFRGATSRRLISFSFFLFFPEEALCLQFNPIEEIKIVN